MLPRTLTVAIEPEILDIFPPPQEYEDIWKGGDIYSHQYAALITDDKRGRIHAPTSTGKSRAASFFAVSPFHRGKEDRIKATFAFPTNILTNQQFERGLIEGLTRNLGYREIGTDEWKNSPDDDSGIPYRRLSINGGGELRVVKLTGTELAMLFTSEERRGGKADYLEDLLSWMNQGHSFLIASPDILAYAANEMYGSSSFYYHSTVKRRVHSLLRGRTLIIDEYHSYDPFTLINFERLLDDQSLAPERVLLLSATKNIEYFPTIPEISPPPTLPKPVGKKTASREIKVTFHFNEYMPKPIAPSGGLSIYIHDSVVENRTRCAELRKQGIDFVQWDGTRKDNFDPSSLGKSVHLVMGTSAIEIGLDTPANEVVTEWWPDLRWGSPDSITQRVGRGGRGEEGAGATAHIYMPVVTGEKVDIIKQYSDKIISKNAFNDLIHRVAGTQTLRRESYVSFYYQQDKRKYLSDRGLLERYESLKYSFRPPGSMGLFIDNSGPPFIYNKVTMVNRYDLRPPTPDDLSGLSEGMKKLCKGLEIDLEADAWVIEGLRDKREFVSLPTGVIDDLKAPRLRKYYVESSKRR